MIYYSNGLGEMKYLVSLHYNKDVVHSNSQHQEGNDLNDNESERDTSIAKDPQ